MQRQFGGSFAPPITAEMLVDFKAKLAASPAEEQIKGAVTELIKMVEVFQETPESSLPPQATPTGVGSIQPLEEAEIKRIWDVVPYGYELDAMSRIFETLPNDDPLRNVAMHLLWYGKELTKDREPMTRDKI